MNMRSTVLFFITVSLLVTNSLFAQEKWTKLFNGKDLTGWKQLGGKVKYEAKNGEIQMVPNPSRLT